MKRALNCTATLFFFFDMAPTSGYVDDKGSVMLGSLFLLFKLPVTFPAI